MHLKIFQINEAPVDKKDYINETDLYEDEIFNLKTDYGGDPVEDDAAALESLRNNPFVKHVDKEKRLVILKDRIEAKRIYDKAIKEGFEKFFSQDKKDKCDDYTLRHTIDEVCDIEDLFYLNNCHTAGRFFADYINGFIPQSFRIGAILDAHY